MPRTRNRTSKKATWNEASLRMALSEITRGGKFREVSKTYRIPVATLHNRFVSGTVVKLKMGRKSLFTPNQEKEIASTASSLIKQFYGFTSFELRRLAYQYAEDRNIKNNFNAVKRLAGKDWLSGFLKRNPRLRLKNLETRNPKKIYALSKSEVNRFFTRLRSLMERYNFLPSRIYNVDEINISNILKMSVVNLGEQKSSQITNWEDDFTLCCAANANGVFVPPMFIFPQVNLTSAIREQGPAGFVYKTSKLGCMTEELFRGWLEKFALFSNSSVHDPVLLILDNHSCHMSYYIHDFCKEKGIVMVSIPPNSSHRLLPLDVIFYNELIAEFNKGCSSYTKSTLCSKLKLVEFCQIFNEAYIKVANIECAVLGFKNSGIYPLNLDIFTNQDFNSTGNEDDSNNAYVLEESDEDNSRELHTEEEEYTDEEEDKDLEEEMEKELKKVSEDELEHIEYETDFAYLEQVEELHNEDQDEQDYMEVIIATSDSEEYECLLEQVQIGETFSANGEDIQNFEDNTIQENEIEEALKYVCCICGEHGHDNEVWFDCTMCTNKSHSECSGWNQPVGYKCDFCLS